MQRARANLLAAICILSSVRTAHQSGSIQLSPVEILIFKFAAIDAGHSRSIALFNVAALYHELVYDPVEGYLSVRETIVFAGAQLPKTARFASLAVVPKICGSAKPSSDSLLLGGARRVLCIQLDNEPSGGLLSNVYIKKYTGQ
jgi:hypothetical protein